MMDIFEEPSKHIVIEKCRKCNYNKSVRWTNHSKRMCGHPKKRYMLIELKGKKFPEWCPLDDYVLERCESIQLKRKKMLDNIKKKKRCRK